MHEGDQLSRLGGVPEVPDLDTCSCSQANQDGQHGVDALVSAQGTHAVHTPARKRNTECAAFSHMSSLFTSLPQ